jgi:anionic cell wall polymer biosynthesis LytR-Cps2A-Psr (LCP) family protein
MERQRCAINAIAAEASPVTMLKRYTKLARASSQIVRTDIPHKLLPAFVELAGKVKGKPIKSVSFELSAEFNPNEPDYDYVQAAVQEALTPRRRTRPTGAAAQSSGVSTADADAAPSKASDATEDCAYRAETETPAG